MREESLPSPPISPCPIAHKSNALFLFNNLLLQLHSPPPAFALAALAALAFAHVLAEAAPFGQVMPEVITIENQKMFISDGVRMVDGTWDLAHQFLSLDLSTAWTSDAPAGRT